MSSAFAIGVNTFFVIFVVTFLLIKSSNANIGCPEQIPQTCECISSSFSVSCVNKELIQYPDLRNVQHFIKQLNVSFNRLRTLPNQLDQFTALEVLDLSNNEIDNIYAGIRFPVSLRSLNLSNNNISNWLQINPNTLLHTAVNLHTFSLAGNPLKSFSTNDDRLFLISNSLKHLNLNNCMITKIGGPLILKGLVNLEYLILSDNPIHNIPDLIADHLVSLDLSRCKILSLRKTVFSQMPHIIEVNLSQNYRLTLSQKNTNDFVQSFTLRRIDLSHCNMDSVELNGFPNITSVNLRNNLIVQLNEKTFANNTLIETLDLSFNSINSITPMTFNNMKSLKIIDLSFNMIQNIDSDTFAENRQLASINLSRNYIIKLTRIIGQRISYLNISWCEISTIDDDAFGGMPDLLILDLSNNLLNSFESKGGKRLEAKLLQILDMKRCRLSSMRRDTFSGFPELSSLDLSGNRFTTTLQKETFELNPFLNDIWLSDNPWRCECQSNGMDGFFNFLTSHPPRIKDGNQLRCTSPGHLMGLLWEDACMDEWNPQEKRARITERIWTITMIILINVSFFLCAHSCLKRYRRKQREAREEEERLQNLEMSRELMRNNRRILEQEALLNAPDPRETHPPCYEDAILLPRLDTSFASLKRAGLLGDDYNVQDEATKRASKRSRCRSEEVICVQDTELGNPIANRMRRHIRAARIRRNRQSITLEIPRFYQMNIAGSTKVFEFGSIEQFGSSEGSPYAKRRAPIEIEQSVPVASTSAVDSVNTELNDEIVIIENHYTSKNSINDKPCESENVTDDKNIVNIKITPPSSLSSTSTSDTSSSSSSASRKLSTNSSSESVNIDEYSSFSNDEIPDTLIHTERMFKYN